MQWVVENCLQIISILAGLSKVSVVVLSLPQRQKRRFEMYELYDKDGKFICYRMTKRIKNDLGEYDVLTARSKKSEKECRKIMDDKIRDYYIQKEEQKNN